MISVSSYFDTDHCMSEPRNCASFLCTLMWSKYIYFFSSTTRSLLPHSATPDTTVTTARRKSLFCYFYLLVIEIFSHFFLPHFLVLVFWIFIFLKTNKVFSPIHFP